MSSRDLFGMALRNLFKRKLRTSLTILSVAIGVVAIVLMLSMGIGVNMNFEKQMEGMGDLTVVRIYNWEGYSGQGGAVVFDDDMVEKISKIDGVVVVTPTMYLNTSFKVLSGRYSTNLQIIGIKPEAMEALGYIAKEGTMLSSDSKDFEIVYGSETISGFMTDLERKKQESGRRGGYGMMIYRGGGMAVSSMGMDESEEEASKVNIFKDRVTASYDYSYGDKNAEYPNNKKPDVYNLKGVGILQTDETKWETTYNCYMDIKKVQKIMADYEKYNKSLGYPSSQMKTYGYQEGSVKCKDVKTVEKVIEGMYELGFTENNVYSPTSWINQMKQSASSLQALLAGIGAVSLFVAAIGIANTMIMSIYERTREIGVMKVIGAAIKDIKKLFLLEAALIGLFGGCIGLGISYLASYIFNNVGVQFFQDMVYLPEGEKAIISYIPVWLGVLSLIFAAGVGLVSGYFPARRATRLSALSAIKSE